MRDVTVAGSVCPQLDRKRGEDPTETTPRGAEDCLFLNVWTPIVDDRLAPVLVFIHGGGFQQGAGVESYDDGHKLAARTGAVVVTLNYRLGALGMMAHEAFAAESTTYSAGNYAIRDQIAALEWVHDHVAAFGGDATNVTIFGESAGAGVQWSPRRWRPGCSAGRASKAVVAVRSCRRSIMGPVRSRLASSACAPSPPRAAAQTDRGRR